MRLFAAKWRTGTTRPPFIREWLYSARGIWSSVRFSLLSVSTQCTYTSRPKARSRTFCSRAAGVKAAFFPDSNVEPNYILNLGYGSDENLFPRSPRLPFETAARIL